MLQPTCAPCAVHGRPCQVKGGGRALLPGPEALGHLHVWARCCGRIGAGRVVQALVEASGAVGRYARTISYWRAASHGSISTQGEGDHHLPTADSSPHASWHDVLELFAQASEVEPAEEPAVAAVQEEAKIHVARSFAVDTSDNEGGTDEQEVVDPGVRQWKALLPFVRRQSGDELLWRRVPSATRRPTTSSSSSRDTELAIDSLLGGAVAWVFQ